MRAFFGVWGNVPLRRPLFSFSVLYRHTYSARSSYAGVRESRGGAAAHNGRSFMDECVVLESLDHEQGIVHAAREVAGENGITYMTTPYRQTLALAFLEIAAAHDRPASSAGKDATARLHLVVKINEGNDPRKPAGNLFLSLQGRRVHVLAIPRDVPAAGKDEARAWFSVVEYRLGGSSRILL